jgi:FkbM family methyltransferase
MRQLAVGKLLNRIYRYFESPGVLAVVGDLGLHFSWVIEAGCHDGIDTLKFASLPNVTEIFAFEPDEVAMAEAQKRLSGHKDLVQFSNLALMDKPGFVSIHDHHGELGTGNTIFKFSRDSSVDALKCSTIDLEILNPKDGGLLWLDVEGSPHLVLKGATTAMQKVVIAQIEVDLHSTSELRQANFNFVHKTMNKLGFALVFAPLHPGFFGDVIYIRKSKLSLLRRIKSALLTPTYIVLHKSLYPLLKSQPYLVFDSS